MSDLLTAARQALEALQYHVAQTRPIHQTDAAITALRAALAEPNRAEKMRAAGYTRRPTLRELAYSQTTHWEGCEAVHPECKKPEQVEQQEPVAWRYNLKHRGSFEGVSTEYSPVKLSIGENWTPLYTTPPQRKPLIPVVHGSALSPSEEKWYVAGWREAEAAHGIGDKA